MMRYITVIIVFSLLSIASTAQKKLTVSFFAGSGLSWYGGSGSSNKTTYNISDAPPVPSYVYQPFGKQPVASWHGGIKVGILTAKSWQFSLRSQLEQTGGSVDINRTFSRAGYNDTTGKYVMSTPFLSFNPEIGKQIMQKKIAIAVFAGFDMAFNLKGNEKIKFYDDNGMRVSLVENGGIKTGNDARITTGLIGTLKKWSLELRYKHGITSITDPKNFSEEKANSRIFQASVGYTILSK